MQSTRGVSSIRVLFKALGGASSGTWIYRHATFSFPRGAVLPWQSKCAEEGKGEMNLRMILTAIVVAAVLPLMADTETVGDYTWTYRINGDESEILGSASGSCISPKPTGSVMVPLAVAAI